MSLNFSAIEELLYRAPKPAETRFPGVGDFVRRFPPAADVVGFSAGTLDAPIVAGLPDGVRVPASALDLVAAVRRLDLWLDLAASTQHWAAGLGHGDAQWVDDDDNLVLPAELAATDVPAFVVAWLAMAHEMGALIAGIAE
jgi:hypothetical protein